ncbi:transcription elongation factor GreA [Candidatus Gracilibacteria bacterium]|jgi:transcription elongation factor GreA|nr:transcription elongation factor GreA [Candidatus Gracilibacteria bacterium]
MAKKHQLTAEGLEKLHQELDELRNTSRLEIAEKLKIAIAYGDLSENSEYQSARDEQAAVEMRISEIEEILENYEVLDTDKKAKKNHVITIGSKFTLRMGEEKTAEKKTFTLVGSTEADILENRISNESPLGQSVMGKAVGDVATGAARSGTFAYPILEIA